MPFIRHFLSHLTGLEEMDRDLPADDVATTANHPKLRQENEVNRATSGHSVAFKAMIQLENKIRKREQALICNSKTWQHESKEAMRYCEPV